MPFSQALTSWSGAVPGSAVGLPEQMHLISEQGEGEGRAGGGGTLGSWLCDGFRARDGEGLVALHTAGPLPWAQHSEPARGKPERGHSGLGTRASESEKSLPAPPPPPVPPVQV